MKKQLTVLLFCVSATICLLLSCKKECKTFPFSGTYSTVNEMLSGPPLVQQKITGIGHSALLGESKFIAFSTLDLSTAPPFHLSGPSTFYAANGDVFYTTFFGTATPTPDGMRAVNMTHTITGGTGRFKYASGNFTGTTIADPKSPLGSITYEGSISFK